MPSVVGHEGDLAKIAMLHPGKEVEWDRRRRCWDVGGEVFLLPGTLEVYVDVPDQ